MYSASTDQPGSRNLLLFDHRPDGSRLARSSRRNLARVHSHSSRAESCVRSSHRLVCPKQSSTGRIFERFERVTSGGLGVSKAGACKLFGRLIRDHPDPPQSSCCCVRAYAPSPENVEYGTLISIFAYLVHPHVTILYHVTVRSAPLRYWHPDRALVGRLPVLLAVLPGSGQRSAKFKP